MITSINGVAYKFIKSNKAIMMLSIFSVILSVALIINMFIFAFNAQKSLEYSIKELYGEADIIVDFDKSSNKIFNKEIIKEISCLENIVEISPVIIDNLQIGNIENYNVYSVGLDNTNLSKSRYKYNKDILNNELIINTGLAEALKASVGDIIKINGRKFELIEVFKDIEQVSTMPDVIFLNINDLRDLLHNKIEATYLMINVLDTSKNVDIAKKIAEIDKDIRVELIEQDQNIQENLSSLNSFISVLSVLIIIMCALLVISNYQTFLYNYRKQFAIIRAIGGSSLKAFKVVLIQCSYINAIGVIIGVIISYFSSKYMTIIFSNKFSFDITKFEYSYNRSIIIAICSFLVLQIFMMFPALKSSKILPLRIIGENEKLENSGNISHGIGIVGIIISSIILITGLFKTGTSSGSVIYGIFSSIILVLSVYLLFPYYIKIILNMLLPIFKLLGGNGAFVAIKNLVPQVKKNSIIIVSLSTVLMIAVIGGSFFNTIFVNNKEYLKSQFELDITVTDRATLNSNLNLDFKNDLDKLLGVRNTCILSSISRLYLKTETGKEYVESCFANLDCLMAENIIPKMNKDLQTHVAITKRFAGKYFLSIGDTINVAKLSDNKVKSEIDANLSFGELIVGTIVEDFYVRPGAEIVLDWSNSNYIDDRIVFYKALISSNEVTVTLNELEKIKTKYPQIKWTTLEQALSRSEQMLYQRWMIFVIVLVAILLSLILGILNILVNNILSKRKEYAILRTLKLDRKGLVKIIITQVTTYCVVGIFLGGILGTIISNIMTLTENVSFSRLDYKLMLIISGCLIVFIMVIFIPFGRYLASKKISQELNYNIE